MLGHVLSVLWQVDGWIGMSSCARDLGVFSTNLISASFPVFSYSWASLVRFPRYSEIVA